MKLSKNFTLEEMCYSSTANARGLQNYPSQKAIDNLQKLCVEVLQPIRDKYGKAIFVNSGYRNPELNRVVGGSQSSQHITGCAADIDSSDNAKLWDMIIKMINVGEITVGQLIWEKGDSMAPDWIHISLPYTKKNQILKL